MVWTVRNDAPLVFALGDAFTSLITGDAHWGWLLGWTWLIGNQVYSTPALCAQGPHTPPTISLSDFFDPAEPGDTAPGSFVARVTMEKLVSIALDRVFGAFCEQVGATDGTNCVDGTTIDASPGPDFNTHVLQGAMAVPVGTGDVNVFFTLGTPGLSVECIVYGQPQPAINFTGVQSLWNFNNPHGPHVDHLVATIDRLEVYAWGNDDATCNITFQFCGAGPLGYGPPEQPQPPELPDPVQHDYPDAPALGHELDRLELKLDTALGILRGLVINDPTAQLAAILALLGGSEAVIDPPVDAPPDVPLDASGTVGAIVSFSPGTPDPDVSFGQPTKYYHVGRVVYGTPGGWYPPQELSVSPMLIGPWGPEITRVQVSVWGSGTASVSMIKRPVG